MLFKVTICYKARLASLLISLQLAMKILINCKVSFLKIDLRTKAIRSYSNQRTNWRKKRMTGSDDGHKAKKAQVAAVERKTTS